MNSSGAETKLEANPGLYQKLLKEEHDTRLVETIELGKNGLSFFKILT